MKKKIIFGIVSSCLFIFGIIFFRMYQTDYKEQPLATPQTGQSVQIAPVVAPSAPATNNNAPLQITDSKPTQTTVSEPPVGTIAPEIKETTKELSPKDVFLQYILGAASCDFALRNSIITSASQKILSNSCSAWKNEVSCYESTNLQVAYAGKQAAVFHDPLSQNSMPPFMFLKEDSDWKINFKFMADNIVFGGSGQCAYPWSWRSTSAKNQFCSIGKSVCE